MRRTPNRPGVRAGFTLVELLVVITILAILFALTAAAVVKVLGKGDEVKVRNEISQLQQAVTAYKTHFKVGYLPDRIVLPPGYDLATAQYITSVWPRISAGPMQGPATGTPSPAPFTLNSQSYTVFSYWGISGSQPVVLHGDQCLVFFLGGPLDPTGNPIGFSSDATDPRRLTGSSRHNPDFEFAADRLVVMAGPGTTPEVAGLPKRSNYHPSFKDIYNTAPYLYFSSAKATNDYANPIAAPSFPNNSLTWLRVNPYQVSSTRFANASSFQIVSAGKDTAFGTGGTAWAGGGGSPPQDGYDDVSNFHPLFLGIPNN